jgi:CIC family chloride channel protein
LKTAAVEENHKGLVELGLLSLVVGAVSGLIGVMFRRSLEQADRFRTLFLAWAHAQSFTGFCIVVVATAASTALAVWLARRFAPHASGSGIPHVEAVLRAEQPPASLILIPVKFVGGVLAIGCGLALGREGPTVQMSASVAHAIGSLFRRNADDCRALLAAGAGAGLAAAFNAPIAGAVFVLEELTRRFETRTAIAALGACAGAIGVARIIHGDLPDFHVKAQSFSAFGTAAAYLTLGALVGLLGVAYNQAILSAIAVSDRLSSGAVKAWPILVGAGVGLLAWTAPDLAGGGDALTQRALEGTGSLSTIALVFAVRFGFGAVSYSTGAPGGLFAPMLVLGAQAGLAFGKICVHWLPGVAADPIAFAVVAMAALFTAIVRAPITGIVLVTEMTGSFTLLLPMLTACFAAMIVPTVLHCPPIYDSLRDRTPRRENARRIERGRSRIR